jgi:hypothetical protein
MRADWKRRFFILDSRGALCYYRNKVPAPCPGLALHERWRSGIAPIAFFASPFSHSTYHSR